MVGFFVGFFVCLFVCLFVYLSKERNACFGLFQVKKTCDTYVGLVHVRHPQSPRYVGAVILVVMIASSWVFAFPGNAHVISLLEQSSSDFFHPSLLIFSKMSSDQQPLVSCLLYIGVILPIYTNNNHYRDPYQPTCMMHHCSETLPSCDFVPGCAF